MDDELLFKLLLLCHPRSARRRHNCKFDFGSQEACRGGDTSSQLAGALPWFLSLRRGEVSVAELRWGEAWLYNPEMSLGPVEGVHMLGQMTFQQAHPVKVTCDNV